MFSRISVPLDGSRLAEQILPFVRLFAMPLNLPVDLFTVLESVSDHQSSLHARTRAYLEGVREKYFSSGVSTNFHVESGEAATVIIERYRNDPHCLIAMATHGMSGLRRWLMGSVTSKVVQHAANPLLIIRPTEKADPGLPVSFRTIIVPLDGSGLAEKALPTVIGLAKPLKLEVQLVRAYTPAAETYIIADGVIAQSTAQFNQNLKAEVETYLEGKVQALRAEGLENVTATAVLGDAASEVIDFARRTESNVVAMSTHGRSGVGRWLLGSVAEKVVQHSQDPVLLIRVA
jgi:nucleotide-binding universal stress UspA family protein